MNVDLYSERKRLTAAEADVYQYDKIPPHVRVQLSQIARAALGRSYIGEPNFVRPRDKTAAEPVWSAIRETLTREYGVHSLASQSDAQQDVLSFLEGEAATDQVLDVVELVGHMIETWASGLNEYERSNCGITQDSADAIGEINHRFQRASCGYNYHKGRVVRVDSQFVHAEVVKPALGILSSARLVAANREFLEAHKHYREGGFEDALTNALKSFESTLKVVHDFKGWPVDPKATAKQLLDSVFSHGLLPQEIIDHLGVVRATLEQGIPTIRNRFGGHGAGSKKRTVPEDVVGYALHITASAIVLLARSAGLN